MTDAAVERALQTVEELFERHAAVFGTDLSTYRGHVHRVVSLVGLQRDVPEALARPLGVAGFFHDAGIWFDRTWDYLPPSQQRAVADLEGDETAHAGLVTDLIGEHHRLRRARSADPLVEAFRRADLTDVSNGLIAAPGVPRTRYRGLTARYDPHGFRPMLLRAFAHGLREAPRHPLPMMKL